MINAAFHPIGDHGRSSIRFQASRQCGSHRGFRRAPATGVVYAVVGAAIALSWFILIAMAVRGADVRTPGLSAPGDDLLRQLPALPLPAWLDQAIALCLAPQPLEGGLWAQLGVLAAMWSLMSVAMMLPSAAPMIRTYCEIADTARAKGEVVVHPLVLVGGYLGVWTTASVGFAALTIAVQQLSTASDPLAPAQGLAAAAALGLAGLYQFSGLKAACLKKCRNPFSILFARWSTRVVRIFRLGLEQGVWCLGCCWALMLVMFAVGVMNPFWMALLGVFALSEKQMASSLPSRVVGAILLVWAAGLLLSAV
ncbi:DUF2182 domain-containing protein [Mesorhizobium sp. ANAO-SY3R2]|uniref:DUF2182 domain-containing protein n=1 Tax=Mesorhizobium sp. ANAO-SY3R2 TaxID=3166644 RepID=UPI00366BACB9